MDKKVRKLRLLERLRLRVGACLRSFWKEVQVTYRYPHKCGIHLYAWGLKESYRKQLVNQQTYLLPVISLSRHHVIEGGRNSAASSSCSASAGCGSVLTSTSRQQRQPREMKIFSVASKTISGDEPDGYHTLSAAGLWDRYIAYKEKEQ